MRNIFYMLVALLFSHSVSAASMLRLGCEGDAAGAEVTVNGQFKGECPLDMQVEAGILMVRAVKAIDPDKERLFEQSLRMGDGVIKKLEIVLGAAQLTEAGRAREEERIRIEKARAERIAEEQRRAQEEQRRLAAEAKRLRQLKLEQSLADFKTRELIPGNGSRFRDCPDCPELTLIPIKSSYIIGVGLGPNLDVQSVDKGSPAESAGVKPGDVIHRYNGQPMQNNAELIGKLKTYTEGSRVELAVVRGERIVFLEVVPVNASGEEPVIAVGVYEVMFSEWDACVTDGGCTHVPAEGKTKGVLFDTDWGRGNQPVINVNRHDAQNYANWLTKKTGKPYRLLFEREWESACRAGAAQKFCGANDADEVAWYAENADKRTHAVGEKKPNAWGLFDMSGNVMEWGADCWTEDKPGSSEAAGAKKKVACPKHVVRGGGWYQSDVQLAKRYSLNSDVRDINIGFRIARSIY